jgi:hypothetical protein
VIDGAGFGCAGQQHHGVNEEETLGSRVRFSCGGLGRSPVGVFRRGD